MDEKENSLALARAGFENAQSRIAFIDSKVSVAVGLLVFLAPLPLIVVGWLTSLEGKPSEAILRAFHECPVFTVFFALALGSGAIFASIALFCGIACLSPRGPKGHDKTGQFHNEWQPNVLFPIFREEKAEQARAHFKKLNGGCTFEFTIDEYVHQLEQLGGILNSKFNAMKRCFWWLKAVVIAYGVSFLIALVIAQSGLFSRVAR